MSRSLANRLARSVSGLRASRRSPISGANPLNAATSPELAAAGTGGSSGDERHRRAASLGHHQSKASTAGPVSTPAIPIASSNCSGTEANHLAHSSVSSIWPGVPRMTNIHPSQPSEPAAEIDWPSTFRIRLRHSSRRNCVTWRPWWALIDLRPIGAQAASGEAVATTIWGTAWTRREETPGEL